MLWRLSFSPKQDTFPWKNARPDEESGEQRESRPREVTAAVAGSRWRGHAAQWLPAGPSAQLGLQQRGGRVSVPRAPTRQPRAPAQRTDSSPTSSLNWQTRRRRPPSSQSPNLIIFTSQAHPLPPTPQSLLWSRSLSIRGLIATASCRLPVFPLTPPVHSSC